jgi:hypothetical protein
MFCKLVDVCSTIQCGCIIAITGIIIIIAVRVILIITASFIIIVTIINQLPYFDAFGTSASLDNVASLPAVQRHRMKVDNSLFIRQQM